MKKKTVKQSRLAYAFFKLLANTVARFVFKRKFLRNELKGKQGPLVVISNHAAALDFVNLIGATRRPMRFVISSSFYRTLPFKGIVKRLGLIPKQQFQTTLGDMRAIKTVIDQGGILVIYPMGLMSDDGAAQPMPEATYQFLKWMKADVYVAKNIGTYFSMPKWRCGGMRRGRTLIDIYKLFDTAELHAASLETVRKKTDEALRFDAYEEQEKYLFKYKNCHNVRGLENILYQCPHCGKEFSMHAKGEDTLFCEACGFTEKADAYGFLHNVGNLGEEIRHPSKWSAWIRERIKAEIDAGRLTSLTTPVKIQMVPVGKKCFVDMGEGILTLEREGFTLSGQIGGDTATVKIPTAPFVSLPYKPGCYIELQHGAEIYRCLPENGKLTAKMIHMIEIFYEQQAASKSAAH